MTTIELGHSEHLSSVRDQLDLLVRIRLSDATFTTPDKCRYDMLCQEELDLLGLGRTEGSAALVVVR